MAEFEINLDNAEFHEKLENFIKNGMNDALAKGLEKACLIIEADAKRNCPVDDGQLRQSITHDVDVQNVQGVVGTNVEYAPYLEIGTGIHSSKGTGRKTPWYYQDAKGQWHYTHGSKAHPFLQPAGESNKQSVMDCFENLV